MAALIHIFLGMFLPFLTHDMKLFRSGDNWVAFLLVVVSEFHIRSFGLLKDLFSFPDRFSNLSAHLFIHSFFSMEVGISLDELRDYN